MDNDGKLYGFSVRWGVDRTKTAHDNSLSFLAKRRFVCERLNMEWQIAVNAIFTL